MTAVVRFVAKSSFLIRCFGSLGFVGISTCSSLVDPALPESAVEMVAPKPYRLWWQLTESCSASIGDFGAIQWYVVPEVELVEIAGRKSRGFWLPLTNRIVLAGKSVLDGRLVRHEMLHALIRDSQHTRADFVTRCDGVVVCADDCAMSAGEPELPSADAVEIPLTAATVSAAVDPPVPSISADSGWIALTVRVSNPKPEPVWIQLVPTDSDSRFSFTFGYVVHCPERCGRANPRSALLFVEGARFGLAAGESRRFVFDVQLDTGSYLVRGVFNVDTTSAQKIDVRK